LGRGDGSAQASQSIDSATVSNVEFGGLKRSVNVQPIVIPPVSVMSNNGTPTAAHGGFVVPGSPNKRFPQSSTSSTSGVSSPLPWQPSTPRGMGIAGSLCGWDSSSTSSSCQYVTDEPRSRAVSVGSSLRPQGGKPTPSSHMNISSRLIIARNRIASPEKDMLCSPHTTQTSGSGSTPKLSDAIPSDDELSSFVLVASTSAKNLYHK